MFSPKNDLAEQYVFTAKKNVVTRNTFLPNKLVSPKLVYYITAVYHCTVYEGLAFFEKRKFYVSFVKFTLY